MSAQAESLNRAAERSTRRTGVSPNRMRHLNLCVHLVSTGVMRQGDREQPRHFATRVNRTMATIQRTARQAARKARSKARRTNRGAYRG